MPGQAIITAVAALFLSAPPPEPCAAGAPTADFPWASVRFTIDQRTARPLLGPLAIYAGDVGREHVRVVVHAAGEQTLLNAVFMRPGDVLWFSVGHAHYVLKLERLNWLLVGQDSAEFSIEPARPLQALDFEYVLHDLGESMAPASSGSLAVWAAPPATSPGTAAAGPGDLAEKAPQAAPNRAYGPGFRSLAGRGSGGPAHHATTGFVWDEAALTVPQRISKTLYGPYRLELDDITGGQVLVTVRDVRNAAVLAAQPLEENSVLRLQLDGKGYVLRVEEMFDFLIGDYCRFSFMRADVWEEKKIGRLIEAVSTSGLTFVRSDAAMSGEQFAAHLRQKHQLASRWMKQQPLTADDFIERVAAHSSVTSESYRARPPAGEEIDAAAWLHQQAAALEPACPGKPRN